MSADLHFPKLHSSSFYVSTYITSVHLCFHSIVGEECVVGPRDLQVSELAYNSLRLTWSPATGDVTGYRLMVSPLNPRGLREHLQQRRVTFTSVRKEQKHKRLTFSYTCCKILIIL